MASSALAHLVMVPNPPQHPDGDFALDAGRIDDAATPRSGSKLTFSGIGVYRPALFASVARGDKVKLAPLLRRAMASRQISGELFSGRWEDIGTPERLAALDAELSAAQSR